MPNDHQPDKNRETSRLRKAGKRSRLRRVLRVAAWSFLVVLVLVLIVAGLALIVLGNLDNATVRGMIQDRLRDDYGLQVDYELLSVSPFSGLEAGRVTVASPVPFDSHAPSLLSIGRLEVEWEFWPLLGGELRIASARLDDLSLCLVTDDQGRSSLQALLAGFGPGPEEPSPAPAPKAAPASLSSTLAGLELPVTAEKVSLHGIRLELVELAGDAVARRTTLGPIDLDASLAMPDGVPRVRATIASGSEEEGLRLEQVDHPGTEWARRRELTARLRQALTTPAAGVLALELDLDLLQQDLLDVVELPEEVLRVRARLAFEPAEERTRVRLERLDLAGGALRAGLEAELRDRPGGAFEVVVPEITLALDAGKLLELVRPLVPKGTRLEDVWLRLTGTDLAWDPGTGRMGKGSLQLEGGAEAVHLELDGDGIDLEDARWTLHAGLEPGGETGLPATPGTVRGKLDIGSLRLAGGASGELALRGAEVEIEAGDLEPATFMPRRLKAAVRLEAAGLDGARQNLQLTGLALRASASGDPASGLDARLDLPVEWIEARGRGQRVRLDGVRLGLALDKLRPDPGAPLRSAGRAALELELGKLTARSPGMQVGGAGLGCTVEVRLDGSGSIEGGGTLPLGRLQVATGRRRKPLLALRGAKLGWKLPRLVPDPDAPAASSGKLRLEGSFPRVELGEDVRLALPRVILSGHKRGRWVFGADAEAALASFRIDGKRHDRRLDLALTARADLRQPGGRLDFSLSGKNGPRIVLTSRADYTRADRSLDYAIDLRLARLGLIGRLLPAWTRELLRMDWKRFELALEAAGELRGAIARFEGRVVPVLAGDLARSLRGEQKLDLRIEGLDVDLAGYALGLPGFHLDLDAASDGKEYRASLGLQAEKLVAGVDGDRVALTGLSTRAEVSGTGRPGHGRMAFSAGLDLGGLEQDLLAGYPVGDARLEIAGHTAKLNTIRVEKLVLHNPRGGTRLALKAAVDRRAGVALAAPERAGAVPGRQALAVRGTLEQDLDAVEVAAATITTRGRLEVPFRLESGDLTTYRLAARLRADGVHLALPASGLVVGDFDGDIPLFEDVALLPGGGARLLTKDSRNIFSRSRFSDTHPFLRGKSFLAIGRLELMGQTLGPLAGNLRIERDTFALDQLQLGYRDGNVTGQLVADHLAGSPRIHFKGNLTGVRPSRSDEVLDANATLTFTPRKLALQGRIQVIRIGRQHLLDVLDLIDPYHENVGVNRARLGLKVGYPKFLRLRMQEGMLAVKLELGGAAGVVRIDEITGIALGPLLQRYVAPHLAFPAEGDDP